MEKGQIEGFIKEARANLTRDRAGATGIGVFPVILNIMTGDPLLRRRLETDSLYGEDLSGKWELPGGGVEISQFTYLQHVPDIEDPVLRYQVPILESLRQELREEAGLHLVKLPDPLIMIPAWLYREYERNRENRVSIDLAFTILMSLYKDLLETTEVFEEKLASGELMFVPRDKLGEIEIVSPRMRFLLEQAIKLDNTIGK